jgi:hypothetical protein
MARPRKISQKTIDSAIKSTTGQAMHPPNEKSHRKIPWVAWNDTWRDTGGSISASCRPPLRRNGSWRPACPARR